MTRIEKEIRFQFPGQANAGIRKAIREWPADAGSLLGLAGRVGFTASGIAALKAVEAVRS